MSLKDEGSKAKIDSTSQLFTFQVCVGCFDTRSESDPLMLSNQDPDTVLFFHNINCIAKTIYIERCFFKDFEFCVCVLV